MELVLLSSPRNKGFRGIRRTWIFFFFLREFGVQSPHQSALCAHRARGRRHISLIPKTFFFVLLLDLFFWRQSQDPSQTCQDRIAEGEHGRARPDANFLTVMASVTSSWSSVQSGVVASGGGLAAGWSFGPCSLPSPRCRHRHRHRHRQCRGSLTSAVPANLPPKNLLQFPAVVSCSLALVFPTLQPLSPPPAPSSTPPCPPLPYPALTSAHPQHQHGFGGRAQEE